MELIKLLLMKPAQLPIQTLKLIKLTRPIKLITIYIFLRAFRQTTKLILSHKTNCRSKANDPREGSASDRVADIASDNALDKSDGQLHKLH